MQDIFIELDEINKELIVAKNALKNHKLYFEDIIENSYGSFILIKEAELCVENMNFTEYTRLVSMELKSILNGLRIEGKTIEEKIYYLEELKQKYETKILELSRFTIDEFQSLLILFNKIHLKKIDGILKDGWIDSLIKFDDDIVINPIFNYISDEIINFIKFYINTKYNAKDEAYSLEDVFNIYQNIKSENLKLV